MNTTIISGNITRDVEIVTTKSEWSILKFSIANNDESRKQQDGSYQNIASFFDCEYLTKKPDMWIRRLQKGSGVVIQGTLKQDQWEKDGQKRSKIKISVQGFPMNLASRDEMSQQANTAPAPTMGGTPAPTQGAPTQTFNNPPVQNRGQYNNVVPAPAQQARQNNNYQQGQQFDDNNIPF